MSFRRLLLLVALGGVAAVFAASRLAGRGESPAPAPSAVEEPAVVDAMERYDAGPREIAAAHILVAHSGSTPRSLAVDRTREEARNRALEIHVMALDKRAGFDELAREYSDDPNAAASGGYLGIIERGRLPLALEVPLWNMDVDQVYPPVETPAGWHVLKRLPLRRAVGRHILIAWAGARDANASVTRTRAQAEIVAREVLAQCLDDPDRFCDLAARHSDDAESRFQCGLVGSVEPGRVHPVFEREIFAIDPGTVSDRLIETEFGFHIVYRDPD